MGPRFCAHHVDRAERAWFPLRILAQAAPEVSIHLYPAACLLRCVTGGGRGCAHAGIGGIQGFPVRASRMAVMTSVPCLRAVSR